MIDYANLPNVANLPTVEIPARTENIRGMSRREKQNYAHNELSRARRKRLVLIGPCAMCGSDEKIQGHHPSYDHPRLIVWLCPKCHGAIHRKHKVPINLSIRADITLAIKVHVTAHPECGFRNVSELTENLWISYLRRKGAKLPTLFKQSSNGKARK